MKLTYGLPGCVLGLFLATSPALAQTGSASSELELDPPPTTGATLGMDTAITRAVQQALNDLGFDAGPADGQWNSRTQEALVQFQESKGLEPSGDVNDRTLHALGVETQP